MTDKKLIEQSEKKYCSAVEKTVEMILSNSSIRLILVAGPSCSGKTTTTQKLVSLLSQNGIHSYMISIDDFYRDVRLIDGDIIPDRDFEAIESIDLDCLHECLKNLADGKCADIPKFDFVKARRDGIRSTIRLTGNDIAIIEGLHALNPAIYTNFVSDDKIFRIFLDCRDNALSKADAKYPRLIRRLVRDSNFRNADAQKTFFLWENVIVGEEKYIYPYSDFADVKINTHFDYELSVLRPFAAELLNKVSSDSEYYSQASRALAFLKTCKDITNPELVPSDSMLREFIG